MLFLKLQLKKNFYFLQIYHVQYFLFVIFRTPAQFVAWKFRGKIAAMYVSYLGGFIQYLGWIFADICKPMLQAKRLLAVVVGSHDTQQHELSVKEGDKVSDDNHVDIGDVGDIGDRDMAAMIHNNINLAWRRGIRSRLIIMVAWWCSWHWWCWWFLWHWCWWWRGYGSHDTQPHEGG